MMMIINSYIKKRTPTIKEETAIPEGYKEKQLNSDDGDHDHDDDDDD